MNFLHGIETIEIADGVRPIRGVSSAVIGLIGTAPDADADQFPLNTPALIAGRRADAAGLGTAGTLSAAVDDVFDQTGALIVVIRIEAGADEPETISNIIGGFDGDTDTATGIQALLNAESLLGVKPKILAVPGYGNQTAIISEMVPVAERLRAVIIAEGPNTTLQDAIAYRGQFGSDRVQIADIYHRVFDTQQAQEVARPPSARVAGLRARIDSELGVHHSMSNQEIFGIVGLDKPVEHSLNDSSATSQLYNANDISVTIRQTGFRYFGNRTCSNDPLWAFLSVRRTADQIYEAIERGHAWALDRPFSAQLLRDIVDGVNAYLRSLIAQGALLGGVATINQELNTEATLKAGQLFIDFDIEPPAPLERLTFQARRNGDYYEELIAQVAA